MDLQRRPLYGIGTVARLTGVKPDTLRIWERRYQLGASQKTPSGRRLFTQADVEHLQLVAAIVKSGTRIGEIASSKRKTLEVLLRSRNKGSTTDIPQRKAKVLFVGAGLCEWMEDHQGFLVNIDALLAPCSLLQLEHDTLEMAGEVDGLVVESEGSVRSVCDALSCLTTSLCTKNVLIACCEDNLRNQEELEHHGFTITSFPPDAAMLACHLSNCGTAREVSRGSKNLGQLVPVKPRLFDEGEFPQAKKSSVKAAGEGPDHLAGLVRDLAALEECLANCSVENWRDVSVNASIYAYTGQARWLMEKALGLAMDTDSTAAKVDIVSRTKLS